MAIRIDLRQPRYDGEGAYWPELASLIGATIVRIGTSPDLNLEGGGLVIEFRRHGDEYNRTEIMAFGFNEVGMWDEDISERLK